MRLFVKSFVNVYSSLNKFKLASFFSLFLSLSCTHLLYQYKDKNKFLLFREVSRHSFFQLSCAKVVCRTNDTLPESVLPNFFPRLNMPRENELCAMTLYVRIMCRLTLSSINISIVFLQSYRTFHYVHLLGCISFHLVSY